MAAGLLRRRIRSSSPYHAVKGGLTNSRFKSSYNPSMLTGKLVSLFLVRQSTLVPNVWFTRDAVVKKWRHTLLDYLMMALEAGQLASELSRPELMKLLLDRDRWWSSKVDYYKS